MAKIMLVEDDNNLREIYEARLLAEGYDIVTARDGEEALAVAVKERPDLVISDVMMPKISGFDMLDILRSTPETKNVKVIMMTALSQAEDKERASKLGADRYLVKSQVTLEDVAKVAHEVLEGAAAVPADDAAEQPATPAAEPTPAATSAPAEPAVTPVAPAATPEPAAVTTPVIEPSVAAPAEPVPQPTTTTSEPAPAVASAAPAAEPTPTVTSAAAEPAAVPVAPTTTPEPAAVTTPVIEPSVAAPAATTIPVTTPEEEPTVDAASLATSTVAATAASGITDLDTAPAQEEPAPVVAPSSAPVPKETPDIERPSAEVWAQPAEPATEEEQPVNDAVSTAEASVNATSSQTLADEEAAIAQQIESIIDAKTEEETPPAAPAVATEEPVAAPTTTPSAEVPTMPELPAAEPKTEPKQPSAGQKVIQPLSPEEAPAGPSIHELAAKEEVAEQATHASGTVIAPQTPAAGGIDPNSLAL
jgi:CheY-like chemotaxis protein